METGGTRRSIPADVSIQIRALPGCGDREQAGHGAASLLPHQVAKVLAHRTEVAQIVELVQQGFKKSPIGGLSGTDFLKLQGQHACELSLHRFLVKGRIQAWHLLVPHSIGGGTASQGQPAQTALLQLQQERLCSNVLGLPGALRQFPAEPVAAPIGVSRHQLSHLGLFACAHTAALEDENLVHGWG